LAEAGLTTANTEIREAINDLSKMPHADITGAIQHSLACLECVAREAAGGTKQTLGELIKSRRDLVPEPLNSAVEKIWGFSSNQDRHLLESINAAVASDKTSPPTKAGTCRKARPLLLKKPNY